MEHNTRKKLPERYQRDYWEFNTKNKNKEKYFYLSPTNPLFKQALHNPSLLTTCFLIFNTEHKDLAFSRRKVMGKVRGASKIKLKNVKKREWIQLGG